MDEAWACVCSAVYLFWHESILIFVLSIWLERLCRDIILLLSIHRCVAITSYIVRSLHGQWSFSLWWKVRPWNGRCLIIKYDFFLAFAGKITIQSSALDSGFVEWTIFSCLFVYYLWEHRCSSSVDMMRWGEVFTHIYYRKWGLNSIRNMQIAQRNYVRN